MANITVILSWLVTCPQLPWHNLERGQDPKAMLPMILFTPILNYKVPI